MKLRFLLLVAVGVLAGVAGTITPLAQTPAETAPPAGVTAEQIIERLIKTERQLLQTLTKYTPLVETYIQNLDLDHDLGMVPTNDKYFLAKLDLKNGVRDNSLLPAPGFGAKTKRVLTSFFSVEYLPRGFANMILIDDRYFDRANYDFTYVRREFLGEVRCFVFDVKPKPRVDKARFVGRIWVEDVDFNIVRFNGTYTPSLGKDKYFHFDSWRENLAPGVWLPAYVYSEESDFRYLFGSRKLRFKGQTRLWGYHIAAANLQEELTTLTVESDQVQDKIEINENPSPVENLRAWERLAEENTLQRIQKAGLLAPEGTVDEVLETVLTNLEVTNNLTIEPGVRARVLLTSPLESFTIGHTVVLSRGLIDVLPDEASLASVLAHELAHIALGHQLDTRYAFSDRLLFDDEETFKWISLKRDEREEVAADTKATEFMQTSPYRDKLANAGLFLRALESRAAQLPNLLRAHIGNFVARDGKIRRLSGLMSDAPTLEVGRVDQTAALPLGSRLRVNPWDNQIQLIQAKPVTLLSAREKMPFEVAPVFLYLKRLKSAEGASQASTK